MAWIYLGIAGLFECGWAISLKYSEGFTKPWPSLLTLVLMAVSLLLLSLSMRTIPMGSAYAVWTGIGAAGVAVLGIVLFNEPADATRLICILLIMGGVIGLKLSSVTG